MNDTYLIKNDKLKSIKNNIDGEHSAFKNGSYNSYSSSYLYDCSDSTIISMRDKINSLYTKIDSGYNNISSWLNNYINENNNLEKSLTNGAVSGVTDHQTNMILSKFVDKNKVSIAASPDVTNLLNSSANTNLRYIINDNSSKNDMEKLPYIVDENSNEANMQNVTLYSENNNSSGPLIDVVEKVGGAMDDIILATAESLGECGKEYLDLVYNLGKYTKQQAELKEDIEVLEKELNNYINYGSEKEDKSGNTVQEVIDKRIDNYNGSKEIEEIQNILSQRELTDEDYAKLTDIQKKYLLYLDKIQTLHTIDRIILDISTRLDFIQYEALATTPEYQEYLKNFSLEQEYNDFPEVQYPNNENNYDWFLLYEYYAENDYTPMPDYFEFIEIGEIEAPVDCSIFYKYTTKEQRMMYHYLFKTEGVEAANEYVTKLLNTINEQAGKDLAEASAKEIDYYYQGYADENWWYRALSFLASQTKVTQKGIENGFAEFTDGIESIAVTKKIMTVDEWKRYYESDYMRSIGFGYYYDVIRSTSQMLPASFLGGMGTAMTGVEWLGAAFVAASSWGQHHDEAVRSGLSGGEAIFYATYMAGGEFVSDYFFKSFPGISDINWESSFFRRASKEVLAEGVQTVYDGLGDWYWLDKPLDFGEISEDAAYSMLVSAYTYFLMNGPDAIRDFRDVVIRYKTNGREVEIRGIDGIGRVLDEAGIIEGTGNFDYDGITQLNYDVAQANRSTDDGGMAMINIDNITDVTPDILNSINNRDRVFFRVKGQDHTYNYDAFVDYVTNNQPH